MRPGAPTVNEGLALGRKFSERMGVFCTRLLSIVLLKSTLLRTAGFTQYDIFGQSGDSAAQLSPVLVDGNHTFATISAGEFHACGTTTENVAWCWGENLASGKPKSISISAVPTAVGGGHAFVSMSAALDYTCALDTTAAIWCFGKSGAWVCMQEPHISG